MSHAEIKVGLPEAGDVVFVVAVVYPNGLTDVVTCVTSQRDVSKLDQNGAVALQLFEPAWAAIRQKMNDRAEQDGSLID